MKAVLFGIALCVSTAALANSGLDQVKTPDRNVVIEVDRDTVREQTVDGITYRSATVIYEFKQPLASRGKKIFYIGKQAVYQCDTKLFMTVGAIMFDADGKPLFETTEMSNVEEAVKNSNAWYELTHVCNYDLKKTPKEPKSNPSNPKKSLQI